MHRWCTALVAVSAFAGPQAWAAENFPTRPVRWIVPNPPGGGSDAVGRMVAAKLTEIWGQQVIIDNRSGAQGGLGTSLGGKAPPDGYTLTFVYTGTLAVNPHIYSAPGFDTLRDFAAVSRLTQQPFVVSAHPSVPVTSLKELAAYAKQYPGKLSFASTAASHQLAGELFKLTTGTNMLHIPYKGAGVAILDLLAGQVNLMVSNPASVTPHVKSGRLRALGALGARRIESLPDVPTASEAGFPELSDVIEWYGVVVPAATPRARVQALNAAMVKAVASPDVQQRMLGLGMSPSSSTPEEFQKQIRDDHARWGKVTKASGAKVD